MKVNFNIYKSKFVKKGFELAANNGALFVAGTSLLLSATTRPLAIMATPKTNKDNKKAVLAKSIASTMTGFLLMLGVTLPLAKSIKKINKEPLKFLKETTINNLKDTNKTLENSKKYQFATQLFKLGIGAVIAAPKAIVTSALIPPVVNKITNTSQTPKSEIKPQNKNLTFTGKMPTDIIAKNIGKIIDKPTTQRFAEKFKDSNFVMHIMAITDSITTCTLAHRIKKSKNIEENKKKNLIANSFISTGLCIASGYTIDKALDKPTNKFINKFSKINKNSPKLEKYIEGIKIAKPTLIMGGIYYMAIPLISTFLSDKISTKKGQS